MNSSAQNPDLKIFEDKLKQLKFELQSGEVKNRMGRLLKDIIYRRVKSGKGVTSESADSPDQEKLKKLSKKYITMREGIGGTHYKIKAAPKEKRKTITAIYRRERNNKESIKTGEFFSPSRSNLTLTGQLLNSITEGTTLDGFKIFIPNTTRNGSKLTNAQVYEYVKKDRPFFALTDGEFRILKNEFESILKQKIEVIFR